ncbi:hypothetical protein H8356DRAFT_918466 [Neocallimastix lanati (nom. inval.)]|nr:hypothetical protein H8356DRAFT_918466 [Neocallimastix sp. JGI-2020a]
MTSTILEEEFDENYEPTLEEIEEYASFLGMDLEKERHFLWIARESLKAPLPPNWKPCQTDDENIYYFNFVTGESIWDHPCDEYYRKLYQSEKEKCKKEGIENYKKTHPSIITDEKGNVKLSMNNDTKINETKNNPVLSKPVELAPIKNAYLKPKTTSPQETIDSINILPPTKNNKLLSVSDIDLSDNEDDKECEEEKSGSLEESN